MRFEGFSSRTEAEQLRGVTLKGFPLDTPDVLWVHKLIGAQVVEIDGTDRGTVVSVIANPASDLLELEDGHLVPLTFVTDFDSNIVHVDAPVCLLDLRSCDADSLLIQLPPCHILIGRAERSWESPRTAKIGCKSSRLAHERDRSTQNS